MKFLFFFFFNFTILYLFCHISKWIHHRYTCVPHPEASSLPIPSLWVVTVHQPQASSIVHRTWTGDSFHIRYYTCFNAILPNHPTLNANVLNFDEIYFFPLVAWPSEISMAWPKITKTYANVLFWEFYSFSSYILIPDPFWANFNARPERMVQIHSLHVDIQLSKHYLLKRLFSLHLNCIDICVTFHKPWQRYPCPNPWS